VCGLVPSHQIGRLAEARFFVVDTSIFRALILFRQKALQPGTPVVFLTSKKNSKASADKWVMDANKICGFNKEEENFERI